MDSNILETIIKNSNPKPLTEASEYSVFMGHKDQQLFDNERLLDSPRRIKEHVMFNDVRGFVEYCRDFKKEKTVIFADSEKATAHFNYHTADSPSWDEHTATIALVKGTGWKLWNGANNQWMSQADFADFLDRGVTEVVSPSQGDLLELVRRFQITSKMQVDSDISAGGSTFNFREDIKGRASKETIDMPEKIVVRLMPYTGAERINQYIEEDEKKIKFFEMTARLYWRFEIGRAHV
jgi:uncharacterized protein YfdQ (DUF2303 family)